MKYEANSPEGYISQLPEDRQEAMERLRTTIKGNLPEGFEETIAYGMIGYVVPHRIYPSGYHANPKEPLPFMSIASQKNFIALYHMGIYGSPAILAWFQEEYPKHVTTKLDMGKGCIRFKKIASIPYDLIAELCRKITVEDYLKKYVFEVGKMSKK
ncbi:hypothetical protein Back11_37180 [Paenibacillus baekrokdamisoli]|uniref:Uncharacterized protein n=1 Tax=Paenibacillus baekrokdamisoli TaxID=1712516 RepID=A0A3G9JBS5_9BACL|nr:DUF1801 domain-containing protein [Paenibacillus baekrokdamisoli]MBB3072575.1 uncharacterized protein YdhG (YjbR/CyaY superfamily) [Paenibacillus baekrokdamisoli]BBH22373.1 hypothetical protein Back11_37180 [Paenibacillus baekrokdamisoli]